jgi:hypothetical protein
MDDRVRALADRVQSLETELAELKAFLANDDLLRGVGILRCPNEILARDMAQQAAACIRRGTTICLPGLRDKDGRYLWDFRIEGGDPTQVRVEHDDGVDVPIVRDG